MKTNDNKNEIDKIKKWEEKIEQKDLIYKANKYKIDFQQHKTIRCFGESIYTGKINKDKVEMDQSNLLKNKIVIQEAQGKGLKILTPKQTLQILPIALAQVKAGNTSENLLNQIRQFIYFLYRIKK